MGWAKFRDKLTGIANKPAEIVGRSVFQTVRKLTGSEKFAAAGARMASVSTSALGGDPLPFRPSITAAGVGARNETLFRTGRQVGDIVGTSIGSLFVGGTFLGASSAAAKGSTLALAESVPAVGEQSSAILAITGAEEGALPAAISAGAPAAAGGSSWLSTVGAGTAAGTAASTVSKLLTKAVDAVISPLFAPSGTPDLGGGGSGGGGTSAGGYPFTDAQPSISRSQVLLIAAALTAILIVAAIKAKE